MTKQEIETLIDDKCEELRDSLTRILIKHAEPKETK